MERYLFFFFQAEDGIRAGTVTGVQTCALPISTISVYPVGIALTLLAAQPQPRGTSPTHAPHTPALRPRTARRRARPSSAPSSRSTRHRPHRARSEERRVGKEGRVRGRAASST